MLLKVNQKESGYPMNPTPISNNSAINAARTIPQDNVAPNVHQEDPSVQNDRPQNAGGPVIAQRPRGVAQNDISQRLMTFETLSEKLGNYQPKEDIKIGGLTLYRRSSEFKAMSSALQQYHVALRNAPSDNRQEQFMSLRNQLADIRESADAYIAKHEKNTSKQENVSAMREIVNQIASEFGLLQSIENDLNRVGDNTQQGVEINDMLQAKRFGLSLADCNFTALNDNNIDPSGVNEEFGKGAMNTVAKLTYNDGETRIFKALSTVPEVEEGLASSVHARFELPRFAARNLAASAIDQALGLNVLCKVEVGTHNGQVGLMMEEATGVHAMKTEKQEVDDEDWNRLLGQKALMEADDWKMILESQGFTFDENGNVALNENDKPFVVKKLSNNVIDAFDAPMTNNQQADLQRQLCDLQLLDCIAGQLDRHAGNYMVSLKDDGVKLVGIDNDAAFGHNSDALLGARSLRRQHSRGEPVLLDKQTFDTLSGIDFNRDIAPGLGGRLDAQQIDATRARFETVLERIGNLDPDFIVEDWAQWRSPNGETAGAYLEARGEDASYWARDIASARDEANALDEQARSA
ncbi:MAG: hypothetical protein CMO10_04030 [Thalassospira sp.]|nr:hypothetical protein [Thalassospira sp.]